MENRNPDIDKQIYLPISGFLAMLTMGGGPSRSGYGSGPIGLPCVGLIGRPLGLIGLPFGLIGLPDGLTGMALSSG